MSTSSKVSTLYPAPPLNPTKNQIRVLRLLPGAFDDEIQCQLETVSLDIYRTGPSFGAPYSTKNIDLHKRSQPGGHDGHRLDLIPQEKSLMSSWSASMCSSTPCKCYEALSYTWDPKGQKRAITLNGQRDNMVMENLFRALRRLRMLSTSRLLWIDALCIRQGISQADKAEKAAQVKLMFRIFGSAARVIVWLGDTEITQKSDLRSMFKSLNVGTSTPKAPSASTAPRAVSLYGALINAERFWWERAWIIQEYALARNDPVFCFGPNIVEDTELLDLLNLIGDHKSRHSLRAALSDLQALRTTLKAGGKGPITRHISSMRKASATDARDKVFSILGMIQAKDATRVRVDYTSSYSTASAFSRATCVSLDSDNSLGPLKYVEFRSRDSDLPSWAIDFDCSNTDLKQLAIPDWRPWRSRWCSAKSNPRPWDKLDLDSTKLHLSGYYFDRVAQVVPFSLRDMYKGRFDGDPLPPSAAAIKDFIKALRKLPTINPYTALDRKASSAAAQSYSKVAVDWSSLMELAQEKPKPELTAFRWLEKLFYVWVGVLSLTSSCKDLKTDRVGLVNEWVRYAQFAAGDTVAFTTEKGFLGMAPSSIQVKDEIALLFGSNAPTILRKTGSQYYFRGFGHVWGVSLPNSEPKPNMLMALAPDILLQERTYALK